MAKTRSLMKVLSGNMAAAWAVKLCRPDVVAAYPITPQSELVHELERFHAEGLFDAEMVQVEGEQSAMGAMIGASQVGARVFTATSSWGLNYMYDVFLSVVKHRLPVVMVNVNREPTQVGGIYRGRQDSMMVRDSGWIQIECHNCQEIFDTVIAAFRLAEDPDILLPVMVSYDGWYLSYQMEGVEVATQKDVDRFLAPVKGDFRFKIVPGEIGDFTRLHGYVKPATGAGRPSPSEPRLKRELAAQRAKTRFEEITGEFKSIFGRPLAGQIEEYRTDDAEFVIVAMGSEAMTARVVIDKKRNEGMKVGLVRIRMFRPFPEQKLAEVLKGKKAIGVLEQGICHGWNCGFLLMDLRATLYNMGVRIPMPNFLAGMTGADITIDQIEQAVDITCKASRGEPFREVTWMTMPYLYDQESEG